MAERKVKKIIVGQHTKDGAGVKLVRVIAHADIQDFDPFLMLDAFDSTNPEDYTKGFPWHPHRGIETVTYLIEGCIEHQDNLGNFGSIDDGCCQWMTAGQGIMHQEMPRESPRMLGFQLWLNLPAKDKMCPPQYRDIRKAMVPVVTEETGAVRVLAGNYNGTQGAEQGSYIRPLLLDVQLNAEAEWQLETPPADTLFLYVFEGAVSVADEGTSLPNHRAVLFELGDSIALKAGEEGARLMLFAAPPLHEPIAWGGPIVMNTREELDQAFAELRDGTFIKR